MDESTKLILTIAGGIIVAGIGIVVAHIKYTLLGYVKKQEKHTEEIVDINLQLAKLPDREYIEGKFTELGKTVTDLRIGAANGHNLADRGG